MTTKIYMHVTTVSLFVICVAYAKADVITNNAAFIPSSPSSVLLVAPTPNRQTGLGVQIGDLGAGNYEFSAGLIAFNYHIFLSSPGVEFTPSSAEDWENALDTGFNTVTFSMNETKYFSCWADMFGSPKPDEPDSSDDYGWVSLTYTGTGLAISDSATATSGGIIVGTDTQIPEPSSVLLITIGSGGILFYRRAKRRQQEQHISRRSFR
ncbi:PEP-CTERM sorting domain-containing protein [Pontiella sulfatireligans]|uniref:PEP-CTERM protein-sorting domain-containing protein n=1 Tax=Pontiella sulfatireligans TaxID=2750658 RepID=A0A6C2UK83_9BACT|nr:PEP-CTERM sorting domain-containing protein [Pontiella sulfatireligans]VGO19837.1 hypothetical protein SCARR_01897 [Pontiella sulfatireligans]